MHWSKKVLFRRWQLKQCFLYFSSPDLSHGHYLAQTAAACWNLCSGSPATATSGPHAAACCDAAATCACGTHTGNYQCLCPPGHFGRGTVGHCTRKKGC